MKEALIEFISKPIVIGLILGLIVALVVWVRGTFKVARSRSEANEETRKLRGEIEKLKQHLHTQMDITAKGNEEIRNELNERTATVENLKATLNALQSKPGRAELRALHVFEKAVRIMNARAPGFAASWDTAITDAEAEVKQEESGVMSWVRRPFQLDKSRLGVIETVDRLEDK